MKKRIFKMLGVIIGVIFLFGFTDNVYAASASISISNSKSKVVVGDTITTTIRISSSVGLGSWEWTLNYPTSKFKLVSGSKFTVGYASNGSTFSKSYTYKFKALSTGSGTISVKSFGAYRWSDTSKFNISNPSGKSVTVITQKELEASYSKNNYLSSLSITGYKLSPSFNKSTLEYTVEAGANVNKITIKASKADSKASISGTGDKEVSEGENRFKIVVTAQNGDKRTYTIKVNVTDPNPITVKDTLGNELIVVKRESLLDPPENYELKKVTINKQEVPAFFNENSGFTLVGLKNSEGELNFYIYDEKENTYLNFFEVDLSEIKLYPLSIEKSYNNLYTKTTIKIDDQIFEALKLTDNSDQAIIHALNLNTGKSDYYLYNSKSNSVITYNNEEVDGYKETISKYYNLILLLGGETIVVFLILIIIMISKIVSNRKKKKQKKLKNLEEKKHDISKKLDKKEEKENNSKEEKNKKKKVKEKSDSEKLDDL